MPQSQQSQVWWSFPGGIGWPTPIPLSGGKGRKTRKGRKARKATRRMRGGAMKNSIMSLFKGKAPNAYEKAMNELEGLKKKLRNAPKGSTAAAALQKQINNFKLPSSNVNLYR